MTRLEASSKQALAPTPMPLAQLLSRASANPCTPMPLSQTPPEQAEHCSQSGPCRQQLLQPCLSRPGIGLCLGTFQWLEQAGWFNLISWAVATGQCPAHPKPPTSEVGRANSTGWQGQHWWLRLHPPLLACWALRNQGTYFPGAGEPQDSIHLSPCHFTLSKFPSSLHCCFQPGGSSHVHSMLHHPSLLSIPEPRAVCPPGNKSPRNPNTFPLCSHLSELLPGSATYLSSAWCVVPKLQWW